MRTLKTIFAAALLFLSSLALSLAQSTAFTYNGRLNNNGAPVNGAYEMQFTLYDGEAGGNVVGGPFGPVAADVVNGLFTVRIDFGAGVFVGPARWLKVEVRPVGGAFVALTPRQEVTSSPYAIRAQSAGSVASGSVMASQLDTGGVLPTPGQFLSYNGGNLFWSDPAIGGWLLNGNNAYYTAGSVGIGTNNPEAGYSLEVRGATRLSTGGSGGVIRFGTPSAETGMTIIGANRADLRFDGSTIKLLANAGTGVPPNANGITINTNGNVSLGTASPSPGYRLDVKGSTLIEAGGSGGGFIAFGTPSSETGMTISGNNRADIRFDGSTLKLLAGAGTGIPAPANGIAINTVGNVGMGTTTPAHHLSIIGGPLWTANGWSGTLEFGNASAIGWRANANGRRFGIGQTDGGLYVFHTASDPGKTSSPANYDLIVTDNANVTQPRDKGGLVKAMLYVNQDGTIARCYNGITDSSTGGCGFTVTHFASGDYYVDFNFKVDDRFVSVTARHPTLLSSGVCGTFRFENGFPNRVYVQTYITNIQTFGDDTPFMLIVY